MKRRRKPAPPFKGSVSIDYYHSYPITELIPCQGSYERPCRVYYNGRSMGIACSKCIDVYLNLLRDFAPDIRIIDSRPEEARG